MPGPCQLLDWKKIKEFRVVDDYFNLLFNGEAENGDLKKSSTSAPMINKKSITFTEFLRVNMRLAEDRILSFICVFSTGLGTKWIPGATFYYQPEVTLNFLLSICTL